MLSWLGRDDELTRLAELLQTALDQGPDGDTVRQLDAQIGRTRPRYLLFLVVATLGATDPVAVGEQWLTPARLREFLAWREAARVDAEAVVIARQWATGCPDHELEAVDVTVGVDYHLVRALIEEHDRTRGEGVR